MAYGLLNPLNDSTEWSFRNGQNPNPAVYTKKTYAQVLQDANTAGYNTVILKPSYNNYYQSLAYYTIVMFNLSEYPDYYVANAEYLTMQYENGIALESKVGNLTPNQFRVADYRNGTLNIEYPGYNLYDVLTFSTTKDGKTYRGLMADDNNSIAVPCVILSNANIGEWYFNNAPVVEYTWSSVPAISGKNGTLSLTKILNINDGEPVNNVPYTDNIDFTAVSKVNNMVAAVVQDSNAVIVEYTVPEDTYEYIKLVYKKDHIPEFVSDGTSTDISQGSGEKAILGIADGNTYWFVIFTDKSTSEPVEFRTSATGWDGSEVILMWSGENNKLTAQVSEGHILFKMYSGNTVVYSFTAEYGATVADSYNIYVQFLEDENQQIAKPSFVYYGASTGYSINQEIPTNEEMADIYSWLHPSS